ncbi:hypothetical protein HI113_04615 [Corallococcus exiguus]|uniref:hypothetical protein n=1 Tax=Corallococcus exiguus TaxID=83462 RepID=UPI00147190F7|nr:hypothetical protein [Corallococcus exiguus]NNB84683.1 hypothetical protein [Corallococcus exiguus]NNB93192.1 hypothetical protein [Corallococcus exiguus]
MHLAYRHDEAVEADQVVEDVVDLDLDFPRLADRRRGADEVGDRQIRGRAVEGSLSVGIDEPIAGADGQVGDGSRSSKERRSDDVLTDPQAGDGGRG